MIAYRPLPRRGADRPEGALPLAGGWCWFDTAMVHERGAAPRPVAARDLPAEVRDRLTTPRPALAGLTFDRPRVMGILNVTPDSFSDGGRFRDPQDALAQAARMVADGVDLIDVGGESTRPGAGVVPVAEEIARIAPVIEAICAAHPVPISLDTRKAAVAARGIAAGAAMLNDVSALTFDPALGRLAAETGLPLCLMHAQGDPETMQDDPRYDDVLLDVFEFLAARIRAAEAAGIARDRIIVDPGIGFGKTVEHNLALLRGLAIFHDLGCPILLGASRKRFIGALGGGTAAEERAAGSVAVALHAARQGVDILRVHDTSDTIRALRLDFAINGTV